MANFNKEEIAGLVRNQLITSGYEADVPEGYVSKAYSNNLRIGFYHDAENTLCICVLHRDKTRFAPRQRKVIRDVLQRDEFAGSFFEPMEKEDEIWATTKLNEYAGWEHADIADWTVKLFKHLETTLELLCLT
jgi:hypothetical protein